MPVRQAQGPELAEGLLNALDPFARKAGFQGIPFDVQRLLRLDYKGHPLKHGFVADVICYDKIVVELKAVPHVADEHRAQVLNYLNATRFKLGVLVNFEHHPKLEWERLVL